MGGGEGRGPGNAGRGAYMASHFTLTFLAPEGRNKLGTYSDPTGRSGPQNHPQPALSRKAMAAALGPASKQTFPGCQRCWQRCVGWWRGGCVRGDGCVCIVMVCGHSHCVCAHTHGVGGRRRRRGRPSGLVVVPHSDAAQGLELIWARDGVGRPQAPPPPCRPCAPTHDNPHFSRSLARSQMCDRTHARAHTHGLPHRERERDARVRVRAHPLSAHVRAGCGGILCAIGRCRTSTARPREWPVQPQGKWCATPAGAPRRQRQHAEWVLRNGAGRGGAHNTGPARARRAPLRARPMFVVRHQCGRRKGRAAMRPLACELSTHMRGRSLCVRPCAAVRAALRAHTP